MILRRMTAATVTAPVVALALVALTTAGCSAEGTTNPTASPRVAASPSPSGAASGAPRDESAAMLAWTPPAPVAKTEGKLSDSFTSRLATVPSTAEIISVQASDDSTILTWQLSSETDNSMAGWSLGGISVVNFWPDGVRLVDPVGRKTYSINTMIEHGKYFDRTFCVCSRHPTHVGPDPVRLTAAYPPLPATATTVSVRIPNFAPVTVPVTR
jgi:hypothetical protein